MMEETVELKPSTVTALSNGSPARPQVSAWLLSFFSVSQCLSGE